MSQHQLVKRLRDIFLFIYSYFIAHLTMNPASEWFYGTIQQKFGLAGASLASSSEMNQCIEDLGLGSMESIEQGMLLRKNECFFLFTYFALTYLHNLLYLITSFMTKSTKFRKWRWSEKEAKWCTTKKTFGARILIPNGNATIHDRKSAKEFSWL